MLSATYPRVSLTTIAQKDSASINDIDIYNLLQQRRYLVLNIPESKNPIQLTSRQLQCLILLIKGYSDELAAETLRISRYTFNEHIRLVLNKLNIRKREVLIQRALSAKIWL